jgi:hypothetical protein
MQTPSPRKSIAAFVAVGLIIAISFFITVSHSHHAARAAAQAKPESAVNSTPTSVAAKQDWMSAYGKLPMAFEANEGQGAPGVKYLSHGSGYNLSLTSQEMDLALGKATPNTLKNKIGRRALHRPRGARTERVSVLRMRLDGSKTDATITGEDRLPTRVNYFIGNDPTKWHTDVPAYSKVKYTSVYPGVDLVFYGNQRQFEYDFVVAPQADAKQIALNIDGASKTRLDARGNLIMTVGDGTVELKKPNVYQERNGVRREIAGNYMIENAREVRFELGTYDRAEQLTIDPVITYSTYFGGSGNAADEEEGAGIVLDSTGDAFIGGITDSADLKQVNGIGGIPASLTGGGVSGFVLELNPTGSSALYTTYLGGSIADGVLGIAVNSGNIFVTGFTQSSDFPVSTATGTTNAPFQPNPPADVATSQAAFVTRLNPAASGNAQLVYSSYLGGSGNLNGGDQGNGIAVDSNNNAYVTGYTFSADFPKVNPFTPTPANANGNAFVAEFNTGASGNSSLLFSTPLGGTGNGGTFGFGDYAAGIVVDSSSNAYVVGTTTSTDFPTAGTQITPNACSKNTGSEVFVSEISLATPATPVLAYSTCISGTTADAGWGIALGPNNLVYIAGAAFSADFPVTAHSIPIGFPGPPPAGFPNALTSVAFAATVNTTNGTLPYATFLGGSNGDTGFAIAADSTGAAYVAGTTASANFPLTPGALQQTLTNPSGTAFISKVAANAGGNNGADLLYSTHFGGNGDGSGDLDGAFGIAVSGTNAYITGQATAGLTTTSGAYQTATNNSAGTNAFVAELPLIATLTASPTSIAFGNQLVGTPTASQSVTLTNNSSASISIPFTVTGANAADFAATAGGATPCGASIAAGASCTIGVIFTPSVAAAESASLQIADGASPALPITVALTGTGSNTGDFSLTVPATFNLTSGVAGEIPVVVNGLSGFAGNVNLTCEGTTANVTSCTIAPATAPVGTTATASVTATRSIVVQPEVVRTPPPTSMRQVIFLMLGISMFFMVAITKRFRTRLGLAAAMMVFVVVAGCSGGTPTPQTGSITITGTGTGAAAGITHSYTVTLSISQN